MSLILASKSASRSALLRGAGVVFETAGSGVDEDATKQRMLGESPRAVARALAAEKAVAVSARRPGLVIGADQTLDMGGTLFDKAEGLVEAKDRLMILRGRTHLLHSAVALAENGELVWEDTVTASLTMRFFSEDYLDGYLARGGEDLLGSVGCYQLEGEGVQLFDSIEGDYFTILGLPMFGLLAELRRRGEIST